MTFMRKGLLIWKLLPNPFTNELLQIVFYKQRINCTFSSQMFFLVYLLFFSDLVSDENHEFENFEIMK